MAAAIQPGRDAIDTTARLTRVPETLGAEDARELRWYLGGSALFMPEGSTFGAQLERALAFATVRACTTCGGRNLPARPPKREDPVLIPGAGRVPKDGTPFGQAIKRWRKQRLRELGIVVCDPGSLAGLALAELGKTVVAKENVADFLGELPEDRTKKCKPCDGTGVVVVRSSTGGRTITARPTGSSRHPWRSAGCTMGDPDLARYGRVSRRLAAVRAVDAMGAAALERYHAPGGNYGAVWVLTRAGLEMLEDNPQRLHPEQLFANIQAASRDNATHPLAGAISRANFEAGQLVRRGAKVWNEVGG